jgi:hypothetical protein
MTPKERRQKFLKPKGRDLCHKKQYRKREAQEARNAALYRGAILRIYPCNLCNTWHLTKKNVKKGEIFKPSSYGYEEE